MRLDPMNPYRHAVETGIAYAHMRAERWEDALRWAERALQSQPNTGNAARAIAISKAMMGQFDEARQAVKKLLELDPEARISNRPLLYVSAEFRARITDALRKAGMPE